MSAIQLFQYDIPEVRVFSESRQRWYSRPVIENPSDELWRMGAVRITLSCWLAHEGRLTFDLINRFREAGVKWRTASFDPSAAESLCAMALEAINKEIADYMESARQTEAAEAARLAAVDAAEATPGSADAAKAHKRYKNQMRAIRKRVSDCLERIQIAAERFSLTVNTRDAKSALDGIHEGMSARAAAFAKLHAVIAKKRGKKDAMAVAMEREEVFAPIAADYADDMDDADSESRAAAAQVRAAFGYDF